MMHPPKKNLIRTRQAFTLVELLVVVLILGALAVVALPRIGSSAQNAKVSACNANVKMINNQIELYKIDNGNYPLLYLAFKYNKDYFPDGPPECPFGDAYLMNLTLKRIYQHSH